jgi:hypothetical protein
MLHRYTGPYAGLDSAQRDAVVALTLDRYVDEIRLPDYLRDVLTRLPAMTTKDDLRPLLPSQWKNPAAAVVASVVSLVPGACVTPVEVLDIAQAPCICAPPDFATRLPTFEPPKVPKSTTPVIGACPSLGYATLNASCMSSRTAL